MASTAVVVDEKNSKTWGGGTEPMNASYGKLMMWFFLLSDAFTFSALLITYGLIRFKFPAFEGDVSDFIYSQEWWPLPDFVFNAFPGSHALGVEHAPLVFVGIMTFILIFSSVTMVLAVEAGHRMDKKAVEKWMLWTILGGITFLSCQAWEWSHFIEGVRGMSPNGFEYTGIKLTDGSVFFGANLTMNQYGPPNFAALFFFITGFHGFHVFSGVVLNFIIFYQTTVGILERRGHYEMVEKVGLYWHFVDLVWVFVFTFFYLV